MTAESDSSAAAGEERQPSPHPNDARQDRQLLLEEARTTTSQQLAQINKLDDEAVRTVRIAFVLSGLLVGGSKFLSLPDLGLLGALGTISLVGSLITSLFVYGTSGLFVGPSPDELSVDYDGRSDTHEAYVEVIDRYERGLVRNRCILRSNALILSLSRLLLAGAIVSLASGVVSHFAFQFFAVSVLPNFYQ